MATISATKSNATLSGTIAGDSSSYDQRQKVEVFTYETLTETNSDGSFIQLHSGVIDICFHVIGSDGTGGALSIQGSNDGTNVVALKDETGAVISVNAGSIFSLSTRPLYIRPFVTAGTSVDYDVLCVVRYR